MRIMSNFSDLLRELIEQTSLLHKAISEKKYDLAQVVDNNRSDIIKKLQLKKLTVPEQSQLQLTIDKILSSEKEYRCALIAEKEQTEQELAVFLNKRKANNAYSGKY